MYITKLIKGERISRQVQEHRPVHVDLLLLYYGYVMICAFKENSIIWGIQLKDWRCMFWKTCAQHVSARGKSACPRATCERRARPSRARRPLFGVLGLAYMVFAPAPSPPLVESTAHFENDTFVKGTMHPTSKQEKQIFHLRVVLSVRSFRNVTKVIIVSSTR
jgi:hypothetical protein